MMNAIDNLTWVDSQRWVPTLVKKPKSNKEAQWLVKLSIIRIKRGQGIWKMLLLKHVKVLQIPGMFSYRGIREKLKYQERKQKIDLVYWASCGPPLLFITFKQTKALLATISTRKAVTHQLRVLFWTWNNCPLFWDLTSSSTICKQGRNK